MKKVILICIILFSVSASAVEPDLSLDHLKLIGIKKIDKGIVLVSSTGKSGEIQLQLMDRSMKFLWSNTLSYPNDIERQKFLEILDLGPQLAVCFHNGQDGEFIYIDRATGSASKRIGFLANRKISLGAFYPGSESLLQLVPLGPQFSLITYHISGSTDQSDHNSPPFYGMDSKHLIRFIREDRLYTLNYKPNDNHSSLDLTCHVQHIDSLKTSPLSVDTKINLQHHSFTYNSTLDESLLSVERIEDGFLVFGKLDYGFKGRYPAQKNSEAFVGIWVAKFDHNFNLIRLNEIPFSSFNGMITNDIVVKAAAIVPIEDINGNIIMNIQEFRYVLYGERYMITLDQKLSPRSLIGGKDAFNFFEYDAQGYRDAARSAGLRFLNDDWNNFAYSGLHFLSYIHNLHSPVIQMIHNLSISNRTTHAEESYYFCEMNKEVFILEYLDRKGGTLNIYRP